MIGRVNKEREGIAKSHDCHSRGRSSREVEEMVVVGIWVSLGG